MNLNYLDLLPDEMLLKLLSETDDLKTLSKWCQTSKRVNRICQDEGFWHNKYRKDFGLSGIESKLVEGETWREEYKRRKLNINSPISAGYNHYGIIDQNGNLYMTGVNSRGQLGVGEDIGESEVPILVKFPQKVISISAGYRVTGAVTKDGKAYFWGANKKRRLFPDLEEKNIWIPKELILPGKAIKIEVDYSGYLVLLEDSSVYVSLNDDVNNLRPIIGHLKLNAIDISLSDTLGTLSIIDKDHNLYMLGDLWGFNCDKDKYSNEPIHVPLPEPVVEVSLGASHIMALSTSGNVYTLGSNSSGELGIGNKIPKGMDTPVLVKLPEKIVQIEASINTSSALSETGKLYMWGGNSGNQISGDLTKNSLSPVEISFGVPINFVSIGSEFTIAVNNDQVVNYWGAPRFSLE